MPELPDLEVMREVLADRVVGRTIVEARAYRPGILKTVDPGIEALGGQTFSGIGRRGKHLILTCTDELHVVVHLMLAGRFVLCRGGTKVTKATGFVFAFDDGDDLRIIENGHLKRVKVHLVRNPSEVEWIARAGVEPLSDAFTLSFLTDAFSGRRQHLKKALTDQSVIVGIGTAYADEIMFDAGLSPIRYVSTMDGLEVRRVYESIQRVLREAIAEIRARPGGAVLTPKVREFMKVHKRTGEACPACGTAIAEIRYAQTRTYYCPACQSRGQRLPDRRSWLTR